MKYSKIEQDRFEQFIDGLSLAAVRKGIRSFDRILLGLPGVYPTQALASVQRLVSQGEISEEIWTDAVTQTRYGRCPENPLVPSALGGKVRVSLPLPHPLDYDWRFGDRSSFHLLRKCEELTDPEDCIALLGSPSVLARAFERGYNRRIILLEGNIEVTDCLSSIAPHGSVISCDVTGDKLPDISAKAVMCDPPWYMEHFKSFLWAASRLCTAGGYLLLSAPPDGTRPNIRKEWAEVLNWASQLGFDLLSVDNGRLPYVSPPFERNALRAEGLHHVPHEWRCSNLALFVKKRRSKVPRPSMCNSENNWSEEVFQGVRVRFRKNDRRGFRDPRLKSIVPGDVLPSVSRWDDRRKRADVWTSGNRIFQCDQPELIRNIVWSLASGRSPQDEVLRHLGRALTEIENSLVEEASEQVKNIMNIEWEECENYRKEGL